ncbi:MAG: hypothetical protein ACR65W_09185 [Methylocystis sp.]|uniref:hypothetical protein n=1 Tax=Methylocystis sp. TaxID=1911079 RepID=UPI003DA41279
MSQATVAAGPGAAPPTGRLITGAAILAVGLSSKIIGPLLIVNTDLPAETKAVLSAVVFFGMSKLCLLAVIMVLGKPGFAYLKTKIVGFLGTTFGRFAPAKEVSRIRYRIGLVMFMLPLALGVVMPYVERLSPWVDRLDRPIDWVWDIVFIASFFVLGGDFWDKLRSLFIHGAKVKFPDRVANV